LRENLAEIERLDRLFAAFIEGSRTDKSTTTIRWYEGAYTTFRRFLTEGASLPHDAFITRMEALDEWVTWHRKRGVSPIGTNSYWRALRSFFNDLERHHGIRNPYRTHKAPRFQPPPPKALPAADCRRILAAAANHPSWDSFRRARAVALLATMLYAGLRRSEVLALAFSDVDLVDGTIRVRRGKGPYGGKVRLAEVGPELRTILHVYLRARQKGGFTTPEFYCATRGSGGVTPGMLNVLVRTVRKASGVRFSPHVLRHSFVTHLLRAGVPLYVVRDLAGHSNISSTLIYTRVFNEDRRRGIKKLSFQ
jgi:Site-specific recombinase XerD